MRISIWVHITLAVALGCGACEAGGVELGSDEHEANVIPLPEPCTGVSSVTQAQAATLIAQAFCNNTADGAVGCEAQIYNAYCPLGADCSALLCGAKLEAVKWCFYQPQPDDTCRALFPSQESVAGTLTEVEIDASQASASTLYPNGPAFNGNAWMFGSALVPIRYPIQVQAGDVISGFKLYVKKNTPGSVSVYIESHDGATDYYQAIGPSASTSSSSGVVALEVSGLAVRALPGTSYSIRAFGSGQVGPPPDMTLNAAVAVFRR